MQKHYLVITPFFPTVKSFRGPYVLDQVKALQKTGKFSVVVLKPTLFYTRELDYEYDGVKVFMFNVYNLPSYIFPGFFAKFSFKSLLSKLKKINIDINTIKIIHTHGTSNAYLANSIKLRNPEVKTILQHHGLDVLNINQGIFSKFKWYNRYIEKYGIKICNKIDLHVGVSSKTLSYLKKYKNICIKNEYVLYNGVDLKKFYPTGNIKNNKYFNIGCIANFWALKDQITLLKAVKILNQNSKTSIKVKFIGSGETLDACKVFTSLNKLGEIVEFKKEVHHRELVKFYNSLDLFVLPSYYEAFGCVYTEAYACGVPFIGVENQGISELIASSEKRKWLIEKSNAQQLSELIDEYIRNKNEQVLTMDINIEILIDKFIKYLRNNIL